MSLSRATLGLSLSIILAALLSPGAALADVPGPRDECEVEGLGCESCWEHYSANEEDAKAFKECADPKKAKGLVEACRHRSGAGDSVFFCPEGKAVEKVTVNRGGGCAGCTVGEGGLSGALAALGVALGVAAMRRRKAPRK